MTKKNQKQRPVIPGCDREGDILEKARLKKLKEDPRYTQKFVAGLVDKDQNYWHQWSKGTTKILDDYWLVFADALGFDAFETRPYLLKKKQAIDAAVARSSGQVRQERSGYKANIRELTESESLKVINDLRGRLSPAGKLKLALLLLGELESSL